MTKLTRRSILFGLIAAPVVVRAGLIMPVKALEIAPEIPAPFTYDVQAYVWRQIAVGFTITRQAIADGLYANQHGRVTTGAIAARLGGEFA